MQFRPDIFKAACLQSEAMALQPQVSVHVTSPGGEAMTLQPQVTVHVSQTSFCAHLAEPPGRQATAISQMFRPIEPQVPLANLTGHLEPQVQRPMGFPMAPALPGSVHSSAQDVIINRVPHVVCQVTGLQCVTSAGWSYRQLRDTIAHFEPQVLRDFPHRFWQSHPQWQGLHTALAQKSVWNWRNCNSRTYPFEHMLKDYASPPLRPRLPVGYPDIGPWNYPLVPAMVYGQGNHNLEQPSGHGDDASSQWWPIVVNPWVVAWSNVHRNNQAHGCVPGVCLSLACTNGRPWAIHITRLRVITTHIHGAPAPPLVPPPGTGSNSSNAPEDVSSVEIVELQIELLPIEDGQNDDVEPDAEPDAEWEEVTSTPVITESDDF